MFLSHGLQLEVFWDTGNKPRDKTGEEIDGKLEHKHESEACSNQFPVLFGDLVRPNRIVMTRVSKLWIKYMLFNPNAIKKNCNKTEHNYNL